MRVILVSAEYHPELVTTYLDRCQKEKWPSKGGVMCFEPDTKPSKENRDAPLPEDCIRIMMADYINEDGSFASVPLVKELATVFSQVPKALILDSTTNTTRYSDLDRHGLRAGEIPVLIAKTLYWMPEPPIVMHFIVPSMKPYYVREWGMHVEYAPVETVHVCGQDIAASRIHPIWHRAHAKRIHFTPTARLKRFIRRAIFGRIAKLIPRIRLFR